MNINKNIVIFAVACLLGVGAILVYAKNNMTDSTKATGSDLTQFADNSGQSDATGQNSQTFNTQNNNSGGNTSPVSQAPQQNQSQPQGQNPQNQQTLQSSSNPLPTGPITELMIKDLTVGTGPEVKSGDTVEVHYTGVFLDGRKFDSSLDRGQPFSFIVGAGNVIKGWDQGLIGMKTGGKRQLVIPSDLAYGAYGSPGAIPPNTPLAFEIQLIAIK